jgi:hypothetical protein
MEIGISELALIGILAIPFIIISAILNKAGFSWLWSLCFFIPLISIHGLGFRIYRVAESKEDNMSIKLTVFLP